MLDTAENRRLALYVFLLIAICIAYLWYVVRGRHGNDRRVRVIRTAAETIMYLSWTIVEGVWLIWWLGAYPHSAHSSVQGSDPALSIYLLVVFGVITVPLFLAFLLPPAILVAGTRAQRIRLLAAVASSVLFGTQLNNIGELLRPRDLVCYLAVFLTPIVALVQSHWRHVRLRAT